MPEYAPEGFTCESSAGARIREFVAALKEPPAAFQPAWQRIRKSMAAGSDAPGREPLRIFVRSYARPDLPGHCVAVAIAFYTVPDPHIGRPGFGPWPGLLFDIHKTYQLAGGKTRLVEAALEVHTEVARSAMRAPLAVLAGEPQGDARESTHFEQYGAGRRHAWFWMDRDWGARSKNQDIFARKVVVVLGRGPRQVDAKPLSAPEVAALFAFVERA